MTSVGDKMLFTAGLVSVGYVFVALITAAAVVFLDGPAGWRPIALRAGGSWIAAVGIMVLGLELLHAAIKLPT
jgi:urease accessory protein